MKEREIKITISDKQYSVLSGNAAIMRYRKAGGSMDAFSNLPEDDSDFEVSMKLIEAGCLLIYANIVDRGSLTLDDVYDSFEKLTDVTTKIEEVFAGVPWLTKN